MTMDDRNNNKRSEYWNEDYVKYWKERVKEANDKKLTGSQLIAGDSKTSSDDVYNNAISLLNISKADNILELGCGFGRSLPILCDLAKHVTAVDISSEMIKVARDQVKNKNIDFYVSPSECLPFNDQKYDVIVCFAAFDAMYQKDALEEINRIARQGARILITGKNDNYDDDDDDAILAEVGARSKGHPNYFTDVKKLVQNIEEFGFEIEIERYFQKRGDFGSVRAKNTIPVRFYEYLFILKKVGGCKFSGDIIIANDISKTYIRKNKSLTLK